MIALALLLPPLLLAAAPPAAPRRCHACRTEVVQSPADPVRERVFERLVQLPAEEQDRIAERAYQAALGIDNALAAAAASLLAAQAQAPLPILEPDPERYFSPEKYAPALGLRTRVYGPRSSKWRRVQREFFRDLPAIGQDAAAWSYDYGRNALLRPPAAPDARQRVEALYDGRFPEPGHLRALAEAALDHDAGLDPVADYFEHCYRDRDGNVFRGIRLFDVWGTGRELEVSDVEAIAWLRTVAGEDRVRSPIPGRLHEPIYERIRESFAKLREYRQLRAALAARMVDVAGQPPAVLGSVTQQLDQAWALVGHNPVRMRELLQRAPERKAFFQEVERLAAEPPAGSEHYAQQLAARVAITEAIATSTREILREEGLLGLGRR